MINPDAMARRRKMEMALGFHRGQRESTDVATHHEETTMKSQAHKKALQMADTINHLTGMIDDCVSQLAAAECDAEAEEILLNAVGTMDDRVCKLRQQLKAAFALIQPARC